MFPGGKRQADKPWTHFYLFLLFTFTFYFHFLLSLASFSLKPFKQSSAQFCCTGTQTQFSCVSVSKQQKTASPEKAALE